MSAVQVLTEARSIGIQVQLDGEDLLLEAPAPPPRAVLEALSRHKAEIIEFLRPRADGWSTEDWQLYFEERAAVAEFNGGPTRADAEA
jgi:TubC N-terminal docking domain